MAGVYWIGQDGNTYMKGDGFNGGQVTKWSIPLQSPQNLGFTQINDPVNPRSTSTSTAPAGGAAAAPVLNQGAVDNTQTTIDQLPGILQAALAAEAVNHDNTLKTFDAQNATQQDTYGKSTTTNQLNYDSNFMDSIRAGIKGLGGLMALLRGTGASGGSVDNQVRDTVGGVTSNDIRTGADTRNENQSALDTGLSAFTTELKGKRQAAEDTFANNNRAIQRDNATQMQDLFGKMAGFYGDAGNTGVANDFMAKAGALTPTIAANSKAQVSPYDTTPVVVQAPQLTAFADPTQPNVLAAPSDGQVGSGIFAMSDRRRKEPLLAGA